MSSMNQKIIDAFEFRHATKQFDPSKRLAMRTLKQYWNQVDCHQVL